MRGIWNIYFSQEFFMKFGKRVLGISLCMVFAFCGCKSTTQNANPFGYQYIPWATPICATYHAQTLREEGPVDLLLCFYENDEWTLNAAFEVSEISADVTMFCGTYTGSPGEEGEGKFSLLKEIKKKLNGMQDSPVASTTSYTVSTDAAGLVFSNSFLQRAYKDAVFVKEQ